jgi:hypothetical protein
MLTVPQSTQVLDFLKRLLAERNASPGASSAIRDGKMAVG